MAGENAYGCGSVRVSLDVWDCREELLISSDAVIERLRALIESKGLGLRKVFFDQYEGGGDVGYELILTLEDSFILVETWPVGPPASPRPYMKVIFDFCNHSGDHVGAARDCADDFVEFVRVAGRTEVVRHETFHGP